MQPLYSVDHETRNSCRRDDSEDQGNQDNMIPQEDTPLLHRFPASQTQGGDSLTIAIVGSLLALLLLGVIIGTYLLILQGEAENVLPPVENPLQLVTRAQWDPATAGSKRPASLTQASQVVVVQTDSNECHSTPACAILLLNLQRDMRPRYEELPYNFLVSSVGQTYEGLGWHRPSPMLPGDSAGAMLLAFIGNFTETAPTPQQMDEAGDFLAESMSRRYLSPDFYISGKNTTYSPQAMFRSLKALPRWRED